MPRKINKQKDVEKRHKEYPEEKWISENVSINQRKQGEKKQILHHIRSNER